MKLLLCLFLAFGLIGCQADETVFPNHESTECGKQGAERNLFCKPVRNQGPRMSGANGIGAPTLPRAVLVAGLARA